MPRVSSSRAYATAAGLIFAFIVIYCWQSFVGHDEELYLLGSRRIADPDFLAADFTWSRLPPTTALFDHLIAPLWGSFNAFTIVFVGRLLFWGLTAWSIALLGRTIRMPAWSVAVGFIVWLLWGQTFAICGSPLEGFQVKSFAYPLSFFALTFALRGQPVRAGMAAGLATAFHVVVGGWACLALCLSMLVNRAFYPRRQIGIFLLSTAPFIVPLLAGIAWFRGASAAPEDVARMNEIYVTFAMPHCCDVIFFMQRRLIQLGWLRAAVVFVVAPVVVLAWPDRRAARTLGGFVVALILFFAVGVVASLKSWYSVLTVYPFQLANSLPAMFLFLFIAAWIGVGGAARRLGKVTWALAIAGTVWLMVDRQVWGDLLERPQSVILQLQAAMILDPEESDPMWDWIRENTPRNSVFISPYIEQFWPQAERAQVASIRHPPLDHRLIEWKERLEALNGFQPFVQRGWEINPELEVHEGQLSMNHLREIHERYGATHYIVLGERPDLADHLLHSESGYSVYDLTHLAPRAGGPVGPRNYP